MHQSKVKIYKVIYYLLNVIIATTICYLGALTLNTDLVTSINLFKLITLIMVAFMMTCFEIYISYKLRQIRE